MKLQRLQASARLRLTPDFYELGTAPDLTDFTRPWDRDLDLDVVRGVLDHLTTEQGPELSPETDGWLAPRLHAAVRLTRREASDRQIWMYMAVVAFPDYVRARWGAQPNRYFADSVNQAFARLWWGAELCRNGADYTPVAAAFRVQDVPNTWFRLDAFHNRALATGLTRLVDEDKLTGRQVNALATATNINLTTTALDAMAGAAPGRESISDWIDGTSALKDLISEDFPVGPDDETVPDETVELIVEYLRDLLKKARVRS